MIFLTCFMLSVMGLAWTQPDGSVPACNSINATAINLQQLIALSPFDVYNTNVVNFYACAKVVFTGPGYSKVNYTGTAIYNQGNYTFSYDFNLVNNNTQFNFELCRFSVQRSLKVIYSNLVSQSRASFCMLECASNGIDYSDVMCVGRGPTDYADTTAFLAKTLPSVQNITNAQQGCPSPEYCNFFTA